MIKQSHKFTKNIQSQIVRFTNGKSNCWMKALQYFENAALTRTNAQTVEVERLYGQIGKLTVELNFAKKCAGL